MPPFVSSLRLVALMSVIALVALGVWLADLRLAVALPLVGLAWLVAATIEWLVWRSSPGSAVAVEATPVVRSAPLPETRVVRAEPTEPPLEPPSPPGPEPAGASPEPQPEAERLPRWARRRRLRAVPSASPEPAHVPSAAAAADTHVVDLPQRSYQPRRWNLWELERIARSEAPDHPEQRDEWAFLFVHLRQFANADGELPAEFDLLVRESFGSVLDSQSIR